MGASVERRRAARIAVALVVFAISFLFVAFANPSKAQAVEVDEETPLLVVLQDGARGGGALGVQSADENVLDAAGVGGEVEEVIVSESDDQRILAVSLDDPSTLDEAIQALEGVDGVAYAQPNYVYRLLEADGADKPSLALTLGLQAISGPNDPYLSKQYHLGSWNATKGSNFLAAWQLAKSNQNVTVAVLDTGVRATHQDLQGVLDTAHMKDAYNDTAPGTINDLNGHGTHVAGIVGAMANNGLGGAGTSYNARILPINVFNDAVNPNDFGADSSTIRKALDYLDDLLDGENPDERMNLRVINMSFGMHFENSNTLGREDRLVLQKIKHLRDEHGVLTVCAGGNGVGDSVTPLSTYNFPSDYEECLAVTALAENGTNISYSDYNMEKDISAPGANIYSTTSASNVSYDTSSGTSQAAPVVSGAAALLFAACPDLTVDQAVTALKTTARQLDPNGKNYHTSLETGSAGALDAYAALAYAMNNYGDSATTSLKDASVTISLSNGWAAYTGSEVKPTVTVKLNGRTLNGNSDYDVVYGDNVDGGTATAYVIGKGSYHGSVSQQFPICYDLSGATITGLRSRPYTGRGITQNVIVAVKKKTLKPSDGYEITYSNNIEGPVATVTVRSTATGNCRGEKKATFTIVANTADKSSLSGALFTARTAQNGVKTSVDGKDIDPSLKWTTAAEKAALDKAIASAQSVYDNSSASHKQVIDATAALKAATDKYNAAKKSGKKASGGGSGGGSGGSTQPTSSRTWTRMAGMARYDTMSSIVSGGFYTSGWAVIASGENFPDALAASALAGWRGCPVILTAKNSLSSQAAMQLKRLGVRNAYIMGGTAAVSRTAENSVKALNISTVRVAGATRQETSVAAMKLVKGQSDTVVIATGYGFADTLSIAPWSYAKKSPIVLTQSDKALSSSEVSAIKAAGYKKFLIVGGTGVVSSKVETQLKGAGLAQVRRLAGANRYATSKQVANWALSNGLSAAKPAIANGENYPDALAGAALQGKNASIMVLVKDGNSDGVATLAANKSKIERGYVFGGPAAVSDSTAAIVASRTGMTFKK